ncbi:MAG: PASTA domain-containing protein, partial [Lachnospiraceae bacterium]|nr:PASTA domain-containing protein [Lachnospiraceae bacterium]
TVTAQSTEGGDYAPLGSLITLTVSKKNPTMPELVNDTLENAQAKAEEMGFKIGKTEMETTEDENLNMIVKSQSVEPGT